MYYIYIICSEEGRYYIGSTDDVDYRVKQHNSKQFKGWTNRYSNWRVVYTEKFSSRTEALICEKFIKRMKGGGQFKKLLCS